MSLTVLIHFEFLHLLLGDVVRDHTLRSAFCCKLGQVPVLGILMDVVLLEHIDQFREGRCNKHAFLILDTLDSLMQHLLDDCCKVGSCLAFRYFVKIHKYGNKRCLSIGRHQCDDLILDHLHATVDFFLDTEFCNLVDLLLIKS